MKTIFAVFFLTFFAFASAARAQREKGGNEQSKSAFISVPVSVSDRDGHYIPDLKREDFTVFENGAPQKITFFSTFKEPLKLTLLLDTSKSTRDVIDDIRRASKEFVSSLSADDQCQIAAFDSTLKIVAPFTSDRAAMKNALDRVEINNYGGTLMFDAVDRILNDSFKNLSGRKVIVLLTDGNDFGSSLSKKEFLSRLDESDVLIYTVFFKAENAAPAVASGKTKKKSRKNKKMVLNKAQNVYVQTDEEIAALEKRDELEAIDALTKMSDATAGRFYRGDATDLRKFFRQITGELTQQYRLGYESSVNASTVSREIIVKVNRPNVVVRTRAAQSKW